MGKHLNVIMQKMFDIVGEKFTEDYVKQENWYLKHKITRDQYETFKKWFIHYLIKNPQAQRELYESGAVRSVKLQHERANWFLLAYGWRVEDGQDSSENISRC